MSFDFDGLYEFHGHRCPMSTMGARLGLAAMAALGVTKADQFLIEGHCYARNCALDGIQFATGCTIGNGNLSYEDRGKPSFTLKTRDGGRCVSVSISEKAMSRLADFKNRKAALLEEKEISGLARAMEIEGEIKQYFEALVEWVQSAVEGELVTIAGHAGGGC